MGHYRDYPPPPPSREAGEGFFPLSSGLNSALLGYHTAKLLREEVILVEMLVSLSLSCMKNVGVK